MGSVTIQNPNASIIGDPNAMFALSEQLISQTDAYINALTKQAAQLAAPTINPIFPVIAAAPVPAVAQEPQLEQVTWQVPGEPGPFTGNLVIGDGILPGPFTGVAPQLTFGAPPAPFTGPVPTSPAVDLNFTYPTPTVTLPGVPTLLTLDTVTFDPLVIPSFDLTVPSLTAVAPNTFHYVEGAMYTSQLLTDLQTSLDMAITNGDWTGLPPNIETNLWNRAREREYKQLGDALLDLDRMEVMGFAFPPGTYLDARVKLQTEFAWTVAGLSRDIMTKQAELILENTVKARENAVQLESKFIDYANDVAQRTFEAAKYATEAAIALYNAEVEAYKASLEGFQTQAQIYDTQIKGILAQVQIIQAHIEYEKTKADINTALVQQYSAQVQAALAIVSIYELQVKIIETEANVEKIKVDIFNAQIQAYVGQINAYTANVEAYKATVQTQQVIEEAYKTSVDAYAAEVNAGTAQVNALVAVFKGQIDAYTAQLEGYKAAITGMVGQAQAASLFNTAEAEVYKAEAQALSSYNNTLTAQWEAVINEQEKIAEIGVSAAKANGDLYIAARGLSLDASKVAAQVAAQLGAAALGAIHWASNSSWAVSSSFSNSQATSTATNTNYNISE